MNSRIMRRFGLLVVFLQLTISIIATPDELSDPVVDSSTATSRVTRGLEHTWGSAWSYYNTIISSVNDYMGFKQKPTIIHAPPIKWPFPDFQHRPSSPPFGVPLLQGLPQGHPPIPAFASMPPQNRTCGDIFFGQCDPKSRYRTIDGSCNNLIHPTWGMAGTRYGRLLPAIYSDGVHAPARSSSNQELPPPRVVSYTLFPDAKIPDRKWTLAAMQWGQIITHDMALVVGTIEPRPGVQQCCTDDGVLITDLIGDDQCLPIIVQPNDPDYVGVQCLSFIRGATDLDSGCPRRQEPAEQLTSVTHFLDLSIVYGSNDQIANSIRAGIGGRLRVEVRSNREWLPTAANRTASCSSDIGQEVCYAAGDERVNQNTQLTVLQIIMLREHNRVAGKLALINPHWSDETIYQETRRIVTAMHQQISYYEWLPIFIGEENAYKHKIIYRTDGYVDDYDPNVNPSVLNEHSNAAFRVFHSLIAGYLKLVTENRSSRSAIRLSDWFNRPGVIEQNDNMDDLTRGLADQPQEAQDDYYTKEITVFLFRGRQRFGGDLRATDIQRNRDHGLATYNDFRQHCGMPRVTSWHQLENLMDRADIAKLANLYESPEDIDLTVGGALEFLVQGTLSGPTFLCILTEQFYRTRVGDRFWFENSNPDIAFTSEQLREIRKVSLARWFCDNGDRIKSMQRRAFELPSNSNPITRCQDIPEVDLSFWKDFGPELAGQAQPSNFQHHRGLFYKK